MENAENTLEQFKQEKKLLQETVLIRVDKEIRALLKTTAKSYSLSMKDFIEYLVEDFIKRQDK